MIAQDKNVHRSAWLQACLHLHAKTRAWGQHVPGADAHVEVVGRQDPQVLFREASLRRTRRSVFTQPLLNADSSHIFVFLKTLDSMSSTTSSGVEIYGRTPRGELKPLTLLFQRAWWLYTSWRCTPLYACPINLQRLATSVGLGFVSFLLYLPKLTEQWRKLFFKCLPLPPP